MAIVRVIVLLKIIEEGQKTKTFQGEKNAR
jgi:hypothetical protein